MSECKTKVFQRGTLGGFIKREAILVTSFTCMFLAFGLFREEYLIKSKILYTLVSSFFILFVCLSLIVLYFRNKKGLIILKEDGLTIRDIFLNDTIHFRNIQGFKVNYIAEYFTIYSKKGVTKKTIKFRLSKQTSDLEKFLVDSFKNLTLEDEKLLNDNSSTFDNNSTKENIIASILNLLGFFLGLWTLFYPYPHFLVVLLNIGLPILTIFVICIQCFILGTRVYPYFVGIALYFPAFGTITIFGYRGEFGPPLNFESNLNTWISSGVIAIILLILLIIFTGVKEIKLKDFTNLEYLGTILFLLMMILLYSLASIALIQDFLNTLN